MLYAVILLCNFCFKALKLVEKKCTSLWSGVFINSRKGGGGQGRRARTPGSATELKKKAYLDLTANFFGVKGKRFNSEGSRIFIEDLIISKDVQIEGLSSPGDCTCILQILVQATVNFT